MRARPVIVGFLVALVVALGAWVADAPPCAAAGVDLISDTQQAIREALDHVRDAEAVCRRAVTDELEDARDDARKLTTNYGERLARSLLRDLKDTRRMSERECPPVVRRAVGRAIDALDRLLGQSPSTVAPSPTPVVASAPPSSAPTVPGASPDCVDLVVMVMLARIAHADAAMVSAIDGQRAAVCPNGTAEDGLKWPGGKPARDKRKRWLYPSGKVARDGGKYLYPDGKVAKDAANQYFYPDGKMMLDKAGQHFDPKGRPQTLDALLVGTCGSEEAGPCKLRVHGRLAGLTGVQYEISILDLVWAANAGQ